MMTHVTGIGRNLLASMVVRALRGHVAVGVSLPDLLGGSYNGRLSKKLLAIVDEVREGGGERRYERAQRLKSLITEEHRHINPKYGVQSVEKNCCRWWMLSNHFDALPFDNTDRRIECIENPTVPKSTAYYGRLVKLLDNPGFIGSVRRTLETVDLQSFEPGAHAIMNEAKTHALEEMMSEVDRGVQEFKEHCGSELATRDQIRGWIAGNVDVNEALFTHAIARAGMVNTGHRVLVGTKKQSVVIVRGPWTTEMVKRAAPAALIQIINPSR